MEKGYSRFINSFIAIVAFAIFISPQLVYSQSNVGIGTSTPSAYGHGGVNRLLEIYNPGSGADQQSHLILSDSTASGALGSITWATRATTRPDKRVGLLSMDFEPGATTASPKTSLNFWTHNGSSIVSRLKIRSDGNVGIGVPDPAYLLHLGVASNSLRIEGSSSLYSGTALSIGAMGAFKMDAAFVSGGRFLINDDGNAALGTPAPSTYAHGGTNRFLEIYNSGSTTNAQSHLMLADSSTSGSVGTITWASRKITAPDQRVGMLSTLFETGATAGSPKSQMIFFTNAGNGILPRLYLNSNGNFGIGNETPQVPLSFPAVQGKKISLYPGTNGDYGFGIASSRLQIFSDNSGSDVAIGYDNNGTFNEKFAVKPTGAIAVSGNVGTAGQVLTSNGTGSASWNSPQPALFTSLNQNAGSIECLYNQEKDLPGLVASFTLTRPSQVVFYMSAHTIGSTNGELFPPSFSSVRLSFYQNIVTPQVITDFTSIGEMGEDYSRGYYSKDMASFPIVLTLQPGTYTYKVTVKNIGSVPKEIISAGRLQYQVIPM